MMNNNEKEEERELFWANIFRVDNEVIVAICDKELLGKELNDPRTWHQNKDRSKVLWRRTFRV
jgi:hypothetical protein